jgi:hypothetical protein
MKKKLILLISIVFVLGLVLTSQTNAADPAAALIGYWELDGDTLDSSGLENHGTAVGNPIFEAGKFKEAMYFDGAGDYLVIDSVADDFTNDDLTLSAWIKTDDTGTWQWWFSCNTAGGGNVIILGLISGEVTVYENGEEIHSTTVVNDLQWHHVAYTRIGGIGSLYINGVLEGTHDASFNLSADNRWSIAQEWDAGPTAGDFLDGTVDDVRIYDRGLTAEELPLIMTTVPPGAASEPSPEDEATDVPRDVVLSWTPGKFVPALNGHKLYLSESFDDVNDAVGGITLSSNSYAPPQRLDFETVYYWRVNEVNAPPDSTVFPGEVWSFETEPVGYPIDGANITATASSAHKADTGPENSINGSGLDDNDLHSTEATDMWLSGSSEPGSAWIEYELDKVYKLHQMWVWNSNQPVESLVGFGCRDVRIEYSTNGTDYTPLGTTHEFARAPGTPDYAHNTTVDFSGAAAKYIRLTADRNWGGFMPQYGLSEVRFFYIPTFAREPSPDSGTTDVAVDVTLGFRAGRDAVTHEVYLSSDEQAVIDSNVPVSTVTEASYGPLSLDLGTTYYWKINEVNEAETTTTWQSDLWNFSTHEFFIVDDFEDYNDYPPDEIWSTWIDGYDVPTNGATVGYPNPDWNQGEHYVETTIVHGGSQSMPFLYSNTGAASYSEAERTFAVPQDWAAAGVQTLALHFRGSTGNTGQLYVEVNGFKVVYDGDAADVQRAGWQAWNIELASFGTNLQSVTTMAIGIDGIGASGTLYFDDFRLYAYSPEFITPVEPSSAGLIGHWKFDGDTLDSSGLGNHGTANGDPTYAVGQVGQAISFDGIDDYVVIDGVTDDITNEDITLAGWVKTDDTGSVYWFSCNGPTGANVNVALFAIIGGQVAMYDINANEGGSNTLVNDLDWHHLAYSRSGSTGSIYVDGNLENTHTANFTFTDPLNRWSIGQEWDNTVPGNFLEGMVDDARIYDYALSLEEVAWLTGRTEPFDKPF